MNFFSATVDVKVDDNRLPAQLDKAKRLCMSAATKIKAVWGRMATSFKAAFDKMVYYAKWGAAAIAGAFIIVSKAAMKQEDAIFLLTSALKIAGEYSRALMNRFKEFAVGIQKTTIYGDEFTLSLMQQQKSLGVTSDKLEEAAKMAIGLATATGRDIKSMSMYVALAQQGEFTMLRRYIPALRATTDATEQLKIVTEFAAKGFKLAQERAETTSGSLHKMWNVLGDVAERIGEPFLKLIRRSADAIRVWAKENEEIFAHWAKIVSNKVEDVIAYIQDFMAFLKSDFKGGMNTVWDLIIVDLKFFGNAFILVLIDVASRAADAFIQVFGERLGKWLIEVGRPEGVLGKLSMAVPAIAASRIGLGYAGKGLIESSRSDPYESQLAEQLSALNKNRAEATKGIETSYDMPTTHRDMVAITRAAEEQANAWKMLGNTVMDYLTPVTNLAATIKDKLLPAQEELVGLTDKELHDAFVTQLEFLKDITDSEDARRLAIEKTTEVIEAARTTRDEMLSALKFELELMGKTADEQERLIDIRKRGQDLAEYETLLKAEAIALKMDEYAAQEYVNKGMAEYIELQERLAQGQTGPNAFWSQIKQWGQEAGNIYKNLGVVAKNALDGMADALTDLCMTGKADFKALARSVIADLTRMIIKAQMAQALGVLLGGFELNPAATGGGSYGGTGGGGPTGGSSRSMIGLQHGGEVIRTGLAVVHEGETYSGVGKSLSNNIDVRIHNEGSEKLEVSHVENYMLSDQRIIDVTVRAMKTNLSYRNNMNS